MVDLFSNSWPTGARFIQLRQGCTDHAVVLNPKGFR